MVIQKMNNVLVKHSKILFGVITAVIIISFVWFFTPGVDGSLLFGNGISENSMYGTFMNEKISYADVRKAMRRISLLNRGQNVGDEMAFFFAAQGKAADRMGITASDAELQKQISVIFQEDGKFSQKKYEEFNQTFLQPAGFSVTDYEDALREAIRVEKAQELAIGNVAVSDAELRNAAISMKEKYSFSVIHFSPELMIGLVEHTDKELEDFYNADPSKFLPPPSFDGIAVQALNKDFKTDVSDDDVKAYYDANKSNYTDKDGKVTPLEKVSASIKEILEKTDTSKSAEVINDFYRTVRELSRTPEYKTDSAAMFTDAAKKANLKIVELKNISEETSQAVNGIDPLALQALIKLKRPGSVTNKIRGTDGFTVILLTGRTEHTSTTFQEAKNRVANAYKFAKAEELVAEQVAKFRMELSKEKDQAASLAKLVEKYHGSVMKMPQPLSRFELEQNPFLVEIRKLVVSTDAGHLSTAVHQGSMDFMVFVDKREQADAKSLDEAVNDPMIRQLYIREKKQGAVMEYEEWLRSNCRLAAREAKNKQSAPDQAAE